MWDILILRQITPPATIFVAISCDPNTLAGLSGCFSCLSSKQKAAVKTYLLATILGGSTDPSTLISLSKAFQGVDPKTLLAIQSYLLCQLALSPSTSSATLSCDPGTLLTAAKCFQCIENRVRLAVDTYLIAVIAGGSTDPTVLSAAAVCFACMDKKTLLSVMTYLLCQLASSTTSGCGTPSNTITITGAGDVNANGTYTKVDANTWTKSVDVGMSLSGSTWSLFTAADTQYTTSVIQFPCVWTLFPGGAGPAPTGQYV